MAVTSPTCEFDFLAARARSTEIAAGAEIPARQCSGESGHSLGLLIGLEHNPRVVGQMQQGLQVAFQSQRGADAWVWRAARRANHASSPTSCRHPET